MERKLTPAEVNRIIPELEGIIKHLRKIEREIQDKVWRLKLAKIEARRIGEPVDEFTFMAPEAEIDFLRVLAQIQVDQVRALGGEVKGGYLVDFPARIDDEDVMLCWRLGESEVQWYHGVCESMVSRKPLPKELRSKKNSPVDKG